MTIVHSPTVPVAAPAAAPIPSYAFDSIDALEVSACACRACPLGATATRHVPGDGPVPSDILLIGEGPGKEEDARGLPFVGRAGGLLEDLLYDAGIHRGAVYVTNTTKCRPTTTGPQGQLRDRPPTWEERLMCAGFLVAQFALVQPKLLILCGGTAVEWLGGGPIAKMHGQIFRRQEVATFCMYHPSWALRKPDAEKILRRDMLALRRWLGQHPQIRTRVDQYPSPEDGTAQTAAPRSQAAATDT
jgi:DNA polymerase